MFHPESLWFIIFTAHLTKFVQISGSNQCGFHCTVINHPCSQSCWWMSSNGSRCCVLPQTELGANPLANSGIELGAFDGLSTLYIGIAEAKLTAVPKGQTPRWRPSHIIVTATCCSCPLTLMINQLYHHKQLDWWSCVLLFLPALPTSITELSLDYNKISKVEVEDFKRYKNLQRWRPSAVFSAIYRCTVCLSMQFYWRLLPTITVLKNHLEQSFLNCGPSGTACKYLKSDVNS